MFVKTIQYHDTVPFTNTQYDTVCLWRRYSIMIQYRSQTHSMILYVCKQYCIIILYPLLKHRVWYCMFVKMIQYPLLMAIIQVDLGQKRLEMLDRRLKTELYNGAHGKHTAPSRDVSIRRSGHESLIHSLIPPQQSCDYFLAVICSTKPDSWLIRQCKYVLLHWQLKCITDGWKSNINSRTFTT